MQTREKDNLMEVYHGTFLEAARSIEEDGILLRKCKQHTDFGRGFYVTEHYEYALNTAKKKVRKSFTKGHVLIPAIVRLEYDAVSGACIEYSFGSENLEWLQFIVNNRNGQEYVTKVGNSLHNLGYEYEIVSGRIADQDIVLVASELKEKSRLADHEDLRRVVYRNNPYATQISFHTPNALKNLHYIGYEILKEV